MKRVAVTVLLPEAQAKALIEAAQHAGTIDTDGRVVMDHFILAQHADQAATLAEVLASKPSSKPVPKPVQTLSEAHFNGA